MTIPRLPVEHKSNLLLFLNPSSWQMNEMGETIDQWKEALGNYELALRTIRPNGSQIQDVLRRLDTLMYTFLPITISSRNPHHITASEYTVIVEWKLRRGRWRPQTLPFARTASDEEVKTASTKAFKRLEQGKIGEAFDALLPLPGSSPSVASAILSVRDTSVPFMSHELLRARQGKNVDFFRSTFLEVVENVKAKARHLSRRDLTKTWTAVDVEKAIYAQAHLPQPSPQELRNTDNNDHSRNTLQGSIDGGQARMDSMIGDEGLVNNQPPNPEAEKERNDFGIGQGEPVSQFSRRKKRISVRQRPSTSNGVEVLIGQIDMEDVEELDEVEDGSGGSLYVPKSDPTDVDEDSNDGRENEGDGPRSSDPLAGRTTYHRYR